jgi:transcriptional/translational regulatory protein YebC/TACO1
MAGHSKWKTIKKSKEAEDSKRSALFTRLAKEILQAVKLGESGDVDFNPMLKVAIDRAKA